MPIGALVTLPVPKPAFVTVSGYIGGAMVSTAVFEGAEEPPVFVARTRK